jgi:hypothetical protein
VRALHVLAIALLVVASAACGSSAPAPAAPPIAPRIAESPAPPPWFCSQWHDPEVTMCQRTLDGCISASRTHGDASACAPRGEAWCFHRTDGVTGGYQYCAAISVDCDRVRGAVANVIPTTACALTE